MLLSEINIGAVNFALHSSGQILLNPLQAEYSAFAGKSKDLSSFSCRIDLHLEPMPSLEGLLKIYDNNESWFMLRQASQRWIVHHAMRNSIPYWLTILERGSTAIKIYCSQALVEKYGEKTVLTNPFNYPLDLLAMMYLLSERSGAVIHAAGICLEGKGLIFPGVSGTGKSTFLSHFGNDNPAAKLSDDRIVMRKCHDDHLRIFGTPWLGDAGIGENASAPFSGMYFIRHGSVNRITPVSKAEALRRLMPVISIPWYDREVMEDILDFLGGVVESVPAFELQCTADSEAGKTLHEHCSSNL